MNLPQRWPLHPPPLAGEALSSWLTRIAVAHHLSLEQLLRHNIDHYAFNVLTGAHHGELTGIDTGTSTGTSTSTSTSTSVDGGPPGALLIALEHHTGIHRAEVHRMSVTGNIPWLLDTLEPSDALEAYTTYTRQHQVFLPHTERPAPEIREWRAWLPRTRMTRACRVCAVEPHPVPRLSLLSYLPITLSCPWHGCYLEATYNNFSNEITWVAGEAEPRPAVPAVQVMDRRTHAALTDGVVYLPRRAVHAGVWFRLLRTIIDELSTPAKHSLTHTRILRRVWASIDQPPRGGQSVWRSYEDLAWPVQQLHLEAAASAIAMIETGALASAGTHSALFRTEPHQPVDDGRASTPASGSATSIPKPVDRWKAAADSLDEAVRDARRDPAGAERLYQFLTLRPNREDEVRRLLAEVGITDYPSSHNRKFDRSRTVE